jgi:hypothetical protein
LYRTDGLPEPVNFELAGTVVDDGFVFLCYPYVAERAPTRRLIMAKG